MAGSGVGGTAGATCMATPAIHVSEVAGRSIHARAAWTGDGYGIVWTDNRDGNTEIYFARIGANGQKVGADVRLTNDPAESFEPTLVWTGSELGFAWNDKRDGNTEIYFTRLSKTGQRLASTRDVRVTTDAARSEEPRLVWTGTEYALTWTDTRLGAFDVYFAKLSAAGVKTTGDVHVALGASAALTTASNGFGVAWHGARNNSGLQILFARLDAAGTVVGTEQMLSDLSLHAGNPSIAFDGNTFGVAWMGKPSARAPTCSRRSLPKERPSRAPTCPRRARS
jgi:hypothetical protein